MLCLALYLSLYQISKAAANPISYEVKGMRGLYIGAIQYKEKTTMIIVFPPILIFHAGDYLSLLYLSSDVDAIYFSYLK